MSGNSFGRVLVLTTFGESHGKAVGGILDGLPSRLEIDTDFIQSELNRRKPGNFEYDSPRKEEDQIEILSGIFEGRSTGAPIAFLVYNKDHRPADYHHLKDVFRPSHADYTYHQKYGIYDHRGGGRASARETLARVAGGAFAKLFLRTRNIQVNARISQIGPHQVKDSDSTSPEASVSQSIIQDENIRRFLEQLRETGDTCGGIVKCSITGVPPGLGEPVFDKLQADLAKAMMSINAVKGFEYGSGFRSASMKGSESNDLFVSEGNAISTLTNHSGGIQGGISNGQPITFSLAFKPVSTLMRTQETVNVAGNQVKLEGKGRHDICVVPRALPIVEAMAALVIADHILRNTTHFK